MLFSHATLFFTSFIVIEALITQRHECRAEWHSWNTTLPPPVITSSGMIIGHPAGSSFPSVIEYLGVPFAQPPVGDLRFAAPRPYTSNTVINANTQPLSCPQAPSIVNYSQPENWQNIAITNAAYANDTSEDCLYLNVWTRYLQSDTLKPVLIWFYGGGFHSGGISDPSESGALFAEEQDIVLVSMNYRLNIFGFSGAPNAPANVGLLDQRLAVEWVRDNIAGFGGDPNKVVLFGHSAGGASVDLYNYAWTSDPIISGSVVMSGTADSFGNRVPETTRPGWSVASSLVGCGNLTATNADAVLACMRTKSAEEIFTASQTASNVVRSSLPRIDMIYVGITGVFGPTIDNKTVFQNYTIQGQKGDFIRVPLLVGNANDEACFLAEKGQIPISDELPVTEVIWTCPVEKEAMAHAEHDVPTWKYRYYGAYPNVYAPECPGKAWHGQELLVLFGSSAMTTGFPATQQELAMGAYLRKAWAVFAADPSHGLSNILGWPTFNSDEDNVVALGMNGTLFPRTIINATEFNTPCFHELAGGPPNF